MEAKLKVGVVEHTWLDYSKSWFITFDDSVYGGEITTKTKAIEEAEELAQKLNAEFDGDVRQTNELTSALFD